MENYNKEKALEDLIKSCHSLKVNMNDTFHYACADSCELDAEDALDLVPFIGEYGFDALMAYEAIKRDYDPQIPQYVTPSFLEVKEKLLLAMKEDKNFLVDLNYQKEKERKEILEFGGKLYFKFKEPTDEQKKAGQNYYTCQCFCEGKDLVGIGSNMHEATNDLRKKMGIL